MKKDFRCADDLCSDYNYTCGEDNLTCDTCSKHYSCGYCEYKGKCTEVCESLKKAGIVPSWSKRVNKTTDFEKTDLFDLPF